MRRLIRSWNWAFVILLAVCLFSACKKEDDQDIFVPFLTGKLWTGDTIRINPPLTYDQLSNEDQQAFHSGTLSFKMQQLTFNEDGTVTMSGDYDPAYKRWRLVNNNADIEMSLSNGDVIILHNWVADPFSFSYATSTMIGHSSIDCTFIYK
jgi:hypothetical protein